MKKNTEDIVKPLHACIADGFESIQDFAQRANVSANTISKYMRRETTAMGEDTWKNIQPFIKNYLPKHGSDKIKYELELNADQKILLDAFNSLAPEVQHQKLMEIIQLAKRRLSEQEAEENRKSSEAGSTAT